MLVPHGQYPPSPIPKGPSKEGDLYLCDKINNTELNSSLGEAPALPVLGSGGNEIILHLSLLKKIPSCINEPHYGEAHPANILIPQTATVGGHLF